jgi:hypothetical protein
MIGDQEAPRSGQHGNCPTVFGYKKLTELDDSREIVGADKWVPTRSAYELAHKWHHAPSMPPRVRHAFHESGIPIFKSIRVGCLYVEHPTFLDTLKAPSCTDIMLRCRTKDKKLLVVGVEGKTDETFDKPVHKWVKNGGANELPSRLRRLEFLGKMLGTEISSSSSLRYQLIHRTWSTVHEAGAQGAVAAVVLIHSFSEYPEDNWLDFQAFLRHLKIEPVAKGEFTVASPLGSLLKVQTYFVWIADEPFKQAS